VYPVEVARHLIRVVATTHDGERGGGDRRLLGCGHIDHGTSDTPVRLYSDDDFTWSWP
jgi:hypothetical protein